MKKLHRLAFVFIVLLTGPDGRTQFATADSVVYRLFASLKTNDEQAFRALYPSVPQIVRISRRSMEKLLKKMLPHSGETKEMLLSMADDARTKDVIRNMNLDSSLRVEMDSIPDDIEKGMNSPKGQAQFKQAFSEAFKKMRTAGESKGVHWQSAKLLSFQRDSAFSRLSKLWGELFLDENIRAVGGIIDFRSGKTRYRARVRDMFFVPEDSCWFGGEITEVIRAGETFNEANRTNFLPAGRPESEIADSLEASKITLADTVMATEPPPVKSKTNAKSGNIKTKTLTKSPARKPAAKS